MTKRAVKRALRITALCLFIASWFAANKTDLAAGQDKQPSEKEKTAAEVYKNIQVFNDLPASQLDGTMQFMSAALGVACDHCHTDSWASDQKPSKIAARKMVVMTRNINKESFSNNPAITCYTCHNGQPQTTPVPRVSQAEEDERSASHGAMPTTDEVIGRYTRAIGGADAIEKLKSQVSVGHLITASRKSKPTSLSLEIYRQAPDKYLSVTTDGRVTLRKGFDGATGWEKDGRSQREIEGEDLNRIKREADYFKYLKLRETYPSMRVFDIEKVAGRDAYVVGATSRDNSREKLYFDVATGLLVRRYVAIKTALGSIPEVTDFDDYKEVSGVKLPFKISWSRPPFTATQKFTGIKINVPIDDAKFEKPR